MSRPKQIQTEEDLKRISDIVNINSVKIIKDFKRDVKDFNIITGNSLNNEEKIFFIVSGKWHRMSGTISTLSPKEKLSAITNVALRLIFARKFL